MAAKIQIILIADDLTGALDAIAPFANLGMMAVVATSPAQLQAAMARPADAVAVSTNSRESSSERAAALVRSVAASVAATPLAFKKIDSRLKGHIAEEVAALAKLRGLSKVLICPAIPDMGRVVLNGHLRGFGVATPINIAALFAGHHDLTVIAPDATTDADIDAILADTPADALLVGARGLAAGLARRMLPLAARAAEFLPLSQPIAFAIGSRDPITLAQVDELRRICPDAAFHAAPNGQHSGQVSSAAVAIMQAVPGDAAATAEKVASALAEGFSRDLVPGRACLVLTGGETAAAVLARVGVGQLQVLGEALPGLPLCRALDFPGAPLIVAKSGGFGAIDALSRLVHPRVPIMRQTDEQA